MSAEEYRLEELLQRDDLEATSAYLTELPDRAVAQALRRLNRRRLLEAFELLPDSRADEAFVLLEGELRADLLQDLAPVRSVELFAQLDPDDRAWLVNRLPQQFSLRLLAGLDAGAHESTMGLLGYPSGSTGQAMSPHVVAVRDDDSVAVALDVVRRQGVEAETIYMLPVLDQRGVVLGVVSLRRLVLSDPDTSVGTLMSAPAVVVSADEDQEAAARTVREDRLIAAPVVDRGGRLVGVLTVDDAMRILEEADAEDAARGTGSERLRRSYLATTIGELVRARIGWLLVLILAATFTVNVLDYFEDTISQVVTLALFVPLLIGTGGNAGAQSATTVVRALAVEDIGTPDLGRVLVREVATGLVLGLTLAVIGLLPAAMFAGRDIAVVVSVSLVAICVLATAVGSIIPMLARRMGIDPAVVSAPFISTVVDATGLIVYFMTARVVLGLG